MTSTSTSLTDFSAALDKLDQSGSNWVMFQHRFLIAIRQKKVLGHFDGSSVKPALPQAAASPENATQAQIAAAQAAHATALAQAREARRTWQEKEDLALYLLSQKLPDSIFAKHMRKDSVATMWAAIIKEFTQKSMMMKSHLHTEFMAMRYDLKSTSLRTEFDRVRMKYEELLNAGVSVSDNDYRTMIINFVPQQLSSFLAQISANVKIIAVAQGAIDDDDDDDQDSSSYLIDPEALIEIAIEEWERRASDKRARNASKQSSGPDKADGTAMATVSSSERPGATAGGGNRSGRGGYRGRGRGHRGGCWNCGGRGHRHDNCSSPKKEEKDSSTSTENKDQANSQSNASTSSSRPSRLSNSSSQTNRASSTQKPSANTAVDSVCSGAWSVVDEEIETYDFLDLETYDFLDPDLSDLDAGLALSVQKKPEDGWDLYDSGASHHMCPYRKDFITFDAIPPYSLTAANKESFKAHGVGDIAVTVPNGDSATKMKLTKALYTPDVGFVLISIGRIDDAGYFATFGGGRCKILDPNENVIGMIQKSGGVYRAHHVPRMPGLGLAVTPRSTMRELHARMGHINMPALKDLLRRGLIRGIEITDLNDSFQCRTCILSKTSREPVKDERVGGRKKAFCDEIHSDLWGPAREKTLGGRFYYISFTDDWSRWTTVYLMRSKSDAFASYRSFATWIRTQFGLEIKCLRSDRGGEYLSHDFINYLEDHGTERRLTTHDTPEENGVAERLNRTLLETMRAIMITAQLPADLWGEALLHAVWLMNRTWTRALAVGRSPYEMVNDRPAILDRLPIWGQVIWVHDTSGGKLDPRAREGRWVGFDTDSNAHRIYWPEKRSITVERSVTFAREDLPIFVDEESAEARGSIDAVDLTRDESKVEETKEESDDESEDEVFQELTESAPESPTVHEDPPPLPQPPLPPVNPTLPEPRRSSRLRQASQYVRDLRSGEFTTGGRSNLMPRGLQVPDGTVPELTENVTGLALAAAISDVEGLEPASLAEAKRRPDWLRWKDAMDEEMKALEAYKTWELDDLPPGANVVGCRWVYALKKDAAGHIIRYKARLVAQGFSQIPGIDYFDTYAPVAKMASIRTFLALSAALDYEIHQIDIKNAYLNGEFMEDKVIYMKQPPSVEITDDRSKVLRLLRPLYGLKQSARHWYHRLWSVLRDRLRMQRCEVDQAVYFFRDGDQLIIIVAHVDDLTIMTSSKDLMDKVKGELRKEFTITDLGEIHWLLGFAVKRDREKHTISLSQSSYIRGILQRYGFDHIRPVSTPMNPGLRLSKANAPKTTEEFAFMRDKPYRETVGSANYTAIGTRPDISYVVSVLSRYLDNPGPDHWAAVKHLFAYLSGTADYELVFGLEEHSLLGYTDADGSMHEDRKAISGYAFIINGGAVSWSSKRQDIIALSTTEAEYVAATHAVKEALWLRTLISEVMGDITSPTTLYSDNQGAIALAKDHQYHARTKHIDIHFHFIRWIVEEGKISLIYCPTDEMVADAMTKALPSAKVKHFGASFGLRRA